jgi:hypothetical protein
MTLPPVRRAVGALSCSGALEGEQLWLGAGELSRRIVAAKSVRDVWLRIIGRRTRLARDE